MSEMGESLIRMESLKKVFFTEEVGNSRPGGYSPGNTKGGIHFHRRTIGLWQVHPPIHYGVTGFTY